MKKKQDMAWELYLFPKDIADKKKKKTIIQNKKSYKNSTVRK